MTVHIIRLVIVSFALFLIECSKADDHFTGKWVNLTLNDKDDIGTIDFTSEVVSIVWADGRYKAYRKHDIDGEMVIQIDSLSDLRFKIIASDPEELVIQRRLASAIDTIVLQPYTKYGKIHLSSYELTALLESNLWANNQSSLVLEFLSSGKLIQSMSETGGKSNYLIMSWKLLEFDSLFFLLNKSMKTDVLQINFQKNRALIFNNYNTGVTASFSPKQKAFDSLEFIEDRLEGDWIIRPSEFIDHKAYKTMSFHHDEVLHGFVGEQFSGKIIMKDWKLNSIGDLILLNSLQDSPDDFFQVEKLNAKELGVVYRGYTYKYHRIKSF